MNWLIVGIMAVTATFVEIVSDKLDDNLFTPLFSGFNGQIALLIINYLT